MINPMLMAHVEAARRGILPPQKVAQLQQLQQANDPGLLEVLKNYGEAGASILSGAVAEPISGLAGLGATAFGGINQGVNTMDSVRDSLTYKPNAGGQEALQNIAQSINDIPYVSQAMQTLEQAPGQAGEAVYDWSGSPLLGGLAAAGVGLAAEKLDVIPGKVKFTDSPFGDNPSFTGGQRLELPGAHMDVVQNPYAPYPNAIADFVTDEQMRGQGLGGQIMDQAIEQYGDGLGGAFSSPESVTLAYNRGFRPLSNPGASKEQALAKMADDSSVTMKYTPDINERLQGRIDNDYQGTVAEYSELPGTDGGRIVNTDEARELSPEYRQDRTKAGLVHKASSDFTKKHYSDLLSGPVEPGRENLVRFTAGGAGAGKSTATKSGPLSEYNPDITFDTTMSKATAAQRATKEGDYKKVQQALDSGRKVEVVHVYRDPLDAFENGVVKRGKNIDRPNGRIVPMSAVAENHVNARASLLELMDEFKENPNVDIQIFDNSRGINKGDFVEDASQLPELNMTPQDLEVEFKKILDRKLAEGFIDQQTYDMYLGN